MQVKERGKMKKGFLIVLSSLLLTAGLAQAQYVRVAPPPPVAERPTPPPGKGYIWIPGYQRWDGRAYHWAEGKWALPPRPHAYWVPGRWEKRPGGWVWVPGHWRD
jgi:hypothetical protein